MVRPPSLRLMVWLLVIASGAKAVALLADGVAQAAGPTPPAATAPASAPASAPPAPAPAPAPATAPAPAPATQTATPAPAATPAAPDAPAPPEAPASAAVPADAPAAAACQTPEELLQSVRQERALVNGQKAALDARAAKLDLAWQDLTAQTAQLTALKTEVQGLLDKAQGAHDADLGRLVKLYGAMKPADAASLLDGTDLEVAVMVLSTMDERQAGQIMARMQPDRVQAVSKIILDRSKLPGDQNQVLVKLN